MPAREEERRGLYRIYLKGKDEVYCLFLQCSKWGAYLGYWRPAPSETLALWPAHKQPLYPVREGQVNEPRTQSVKTDRSSLLCCSVLALSFAALKGVKPSLWVVVISTATAVGPGITMASSFHSMHRHRMLHAQGRVWSTWPQKPSSPHLKSCWEQACFTKSNHLDCLPLQDILTCFSLSLFTPVITNEEESEEQSKEMNLENSWQHFCSAQCTHMAGHRCLQREGA